MANVVRYSDEEKARVKVALEANRTPDGTYNIKATSRETGVSRGTISTWIKKWDVGRAVRGNAGGTTRLSAISW
jgi:transposase-like protein